MKKIIFAVVALLLIGGTIGGFSWWQKQQYQRFAKRACVYTLLPLVVQHHEKVNFESSFPQQSGPSEIFVVTKVVDQKLLKISHDFTSQNHQEFTKIKKQHWINKKIDEATFLLANEAPEFFQSCLQTFNDSQKKCEDPDNQFCLEKSTDDIKKLIFKLYPKLG